MNAVYSRLGLNALSRRLRLRGRFYRRSLLLILILASIPGLITGAIIYWFAVAQIEDDLMHLHQDQIESRVANINDQFAYLELNLSHWALQPRFGYNLRQLDFVYQFQETREINRTLLIMKRSNPLIKNVELFLLEPSPLLLQPEYTPMPSEILNVEYARFLDDPRSIYWTQGLPQGLTEPGSSRIVEVTIEEMILLVQKIPGDFSRPFGVLIASLNSEKVMSLLHTMTPYSDGTTFLIGFNDEILLSSSDDNSLDDVLLRQVMMSDEAAGSFLFEWGGVSYTVSYGTFPRIDHDWIYVSAAPISAITSPIKFISMLIIFGSLTVLIVALFASWLASRRIYTPIRRLMDMFSIDEDSAYVDDVHGDEFTYFEQRWQHITSETNQLQRRLDEQRSHVKEGFLLQLLQGHLHFYSESDLRLRMKYYGWQIEAKQFVMLKIQLTGFSNIKDRFTSGDEGLVTFAAANIIDELSKRMLEQYNVLNFHNLSIGLLVILPENDVNYNEQLLNLSKEYTEAINSMIKMQVTITISQPTTHVKEIATLLMDVEHAASYRIFDDENQIIDMSDLPRGLIEQKPHYPFALEKEIIHALRMGEQSTAEQLISQFLEDVSVSNGREVFVRQCMLQLLGTMQHMMLQSGIQPYQLLNGINGFERLANIRESDKMLRWINEKIIQPYINEMNERSNSQMKRMVEKTLMILEEEYMNDISLEWCADMNETNPYTLSKAFKQIAGKNFIEYLTELRIEKAKELLRETDMKINDISEQVGYQNSYFNRIFKKQEGMTPSQYRDNWDN